MAVHLFTGPLGNGKTLSAVQKFFDWSWLKGGYVFTNVAVNWDECKKHAREVHGVELEDRQLVLLTGDQVAEFHKHVQRGTEKVPALLVIDEAGKYFNSKAWNKNLDVKMILSDMLRESRKLCMEVIFIVQNEERLQKDFRELMEFLWRFRSLKWVPILRHYTIQTQLHYDTDVKVRSIWWRRDKRLFKCYDTLALYSAWDCASVPQLEPVQFETKPKKPLPFMLRVAMLVGLVWLCWNMISGLTKSLGNSKLGGAKKEPEKASPAVLPAKVPPVSNPAPAVAAPALAMPAPFPGHRIVQEAFRGTDERSFLRTQEGEYSVGQWSHLGLVQNVARRSARIIAPNGETVIVIARDWLDVRPGVESAPASSSPVPSMSEALAMSPQARVMGGYPAPEDAERIARARAGIAQDSPVAKVSADKPELSPPSSGILPPKFRGASSVGVVQLR